MNEAFNMDCMEYMRTLPDKAFDLAVVDPPYGGGSQIFSVDGKLQGGHTDWESKKRSRFGGLFDKYYICSEDRRKLVEKVSDSHRDIQHWDIAPPKEYFDELARVSKNQIIWGGNYFNLPPTRCFLVWRKLTISDRFSMAMAEYAWTSFNDNAKVFEYAPQDKTRFHPTQKPIALYAWIYSKYAKPRDKILDTHLGSGSSRIAAYDAGLDFVGCEIDPYYFKAQEERFQAHTSQVNLFLEMEKQEGME